MAAVEGTLAVRAAGGSWTDSAVNEPVAAGMSVRTGPDGRGILRLGADIVALGPGSEVAIAELGAEGGRLALRQGRIGVRLSAAEPARLFDIDVPRGAVRLLSAGEYDIEAGGEHAAGRLAALEGRARFTDQGLDQGLETSVAAGQTVLLKGGEPASLSGERAAADAFDVWWQWAAAEPPDPPALRHVAPAMTGYDTLDEYGTWRTLAGLGPVWTPNTVPDDWAPYRFGHWRHIAPWGWTWIDDMPWGFAPSHYGRWTRLRGRDDDEPEHWAWVPGRKTAEPAYMPAAVAFLGTAGVGLSYPDAFGPAVAWFPLAPGEVYWPDYTDDLAEIRRLNAGSVEDLSAVDRAATGDPPAAIVHDDYLYRRFASVVPRSVFLAGRAVAPALVQLPYRRLANAPLIAGSPQIAAATARAAVAVAAGRSVNVKLAHAVETLGRILKPRPGGPRQAARPRRSGRVPAAHAHAHAAKGHPAHQRAAAAAAPARSAPAHMAQGRLRLAAAAARRR